MKKSAIVALFFCITLVLTASPLAASDSSKPAKQVWITDAFIVSPESLDHIAKGSVLIENGRVARIERNRPRISRGSTYTSPTFRA
jgi:hypothetical protein